MTERKWTPGPWRVVYYDCGDKDEWIDCPMIDGSEEADRSVVHWDGFKQRFWKSADGKQSEIDANAHLIAAAPDLYEALAKCLNAYETMAHSEFDGVWSSEDFEDEFAPFKSALAKARGEQ